MGIADINDIESVLGLSRNHWPNAFPLGDSAATAGSNSSISNKTTIGDLPNWCMSIALACRMDHRYNNQLAMKNLATQLLENALLRWPFILAMLLEKCDTNISTTKWKTILNKPYFSTAASRYLLLY